MRTKRFLLFLNLLFILSCNSNVDYYHLPTFSSNKQINAIVEIPAGTNKKFEYNKTTHTFEIDQKNGLDRIVQFLPYIGNYGYIPSTYSDPKKGGDGDALDVLVLSESLPTGSVVEIIPIAMLKLIDDGELDYKIIAVPFNKADQVIKATNYKQFDEKHPQIKKIIELWFLNYNKDDEARIDGWANEKEAIKEINSNLL
ncbi:inorganic pyrophosphatase [Formosa sp. Hel1_31_208]|uniref:inorganic diphosphatase n=1 Tax=Formosa sp. Hel1_31_208 TaxID=1798225 RepID=UPI0008796681|nr:inorganic diphosphatase [Formosa sp. Hel1_31_208]SDR75094.1 inorganic pyrophosphatase [Formosa sp. Hel1_31_208]